MMHARLLCMPVRTHHRVPVAFSSRACVHEQVHMTWLYQPQTEGGMHLSALFALQ